MLEKLMSFKQISTRLEISFWQLVIQLLSESYTIQEIIAWVYHRGSPGMARFVHRFDVEKALRWAAYGLALGFLIGFLSALV
jgi:hypothetical protein